MLVYAFVIFTVYLLFFVEIYRYSAVKSKRLFYIGAFLVTFILAFRGNNVGGDMIEYCYFFDGRGTQEYGTIDDPSDGFGIGFVLFSRLLRLFGKEHFIFIFSTSLVTILPFLYIIWRDCKFKILPLCLYMTSFSLLTLSQTCIRQNLGISILFMVYIYLTRKESLNKFSYIIVPIGLIVSVLCHTTSLLSIILAIFVLFFPMNKKSATCIISLSALIIIVAPNITKNIFQFIFILLSLAEGDDVSHLLLYDDPAKQNDSSQILKAIIAMSFFLLLYIKMTSREQFKGDRLKNLPVKCFVWGTAISFITSGFELSSRLILFLTSLGVTSSPNKMLDKCNRPYLMVFILLLFLFAYLELKYLAFAKSAIQYDQLVPYFFIFE